jgi:hypothetical protein
MKLERLVWFGLVVLCLCAGPALFAEDGIAEKIVEVLETNRSGECPEHLMAPILLDICEQQVSMMQRRLEQLGDIKRTQYRGKEKLANGVEAEVYKVYFENGTMIWAATEDSDGKLNFMWSPG